MAAAADLAFTVLIARATDARGVRGCQLTAKAEGRPVDLDESTLESLAENAKIHYRKLFSSEPVHVGVAALPYLASFDESEREGSEVVGAGIEFQEGVSDDEVFEAVTEAVELFAGVSEAGLRPRDRLAVALREINRDLTIKAARGKFEDKPSLNVLQVTLNSIGSTAAVELANRISAGDFDPEGPGGGA